MKDSGFLLILLCLDKKLPRIGGAKPGGTGQRTIADSRQERAELGGITVRTAITQYVLA